MDIEVYGVKRPLPDGFEEFVDPRNTVVVSIDLHKGHLSEDPACPCPAPRAREVVEGCNQFHRSARRLGIPVIHVRSGLRPGGLDDVKGIPSAWRLVFPLHVGPIPNAEEHAIYGTPWREFVTEVDTADIVIEGKKRLSAFFPTDLDFLLRNMGTRRIVFTGCMADCCILNSAFDASNLGYRITVLSDLVRGTDAALEEAALKIVSLHLGLVTDSANLEVEWNDRLRSTKVEGARPDVSLP